MSTIQKTSDFLTLAESWDISYNISYNLPYLEEVFEYYA